MTVPRGGSDIEERLLVRYDCGENVLWGISDGLTNIVAIFAHAEECTLAANALNEESDAIRDLRAERDDLRSLANAERDTRQAAHVEREIEFMRAERAKELLTGLLGHHGNWCKCATTPQVAFDALAFLRERST